MNDNRENFQQAINSMLQGFQYIVDKAKQENTQIYNGILLSLTEDGNIGTVLINGKQYSLPFNGSPPDRSTGVTVKVFVPQGNMNLAFCLYIPNDIATQSWVLQERPYKTWVGTQAQYDSIPASQIDDFTKYYILTE